jgi:predicted esterase
MTDAEVHSIEVPRTARYFVCGSEHPSETWFVLHGYGQLAEPFLKELRELERPDRRLVAPEALSRYYLKRGTGTVGASWMTREQRTSEIRDTLRYLDLVHETLAPASGALTAFGFSQGGAAAARWAVLGRTPVARLISYACPLPSDLELERQAARVRALRWTFVLGAQDQSIDRAAFEAGLQRLRVAGCEPELITFPGAHVLDSDVLRGLG